MNKLYESTKALYSFNFFVGAISTFSITPFSFFPIILALGFGIYSISLTPSFKKTFIASWFLGFGWFSFGLYWIGSAFFVAETYHMFLMPLAVIILPSILALFWALAFFLAKLLTPKNKSPILLMIINLSLIEYCRANIFTILREITLPLLMPGLVSAGLFAFLLSWGNFPLSLFTTGADSTLPEWLYAKMVSGYSPLVPTLGIMSVIGSFLIIMIALALSGLWRAKRATRSAVTN